MRRRILQSSVAVVTALAGLAGGGAAAAGAAAWVLPPTPLAATADGPGGAVVAVDPAGDAVAAWTDDDGAGTQTLLAAARPAGDAWGAPVTLASDVGVDAPSLALDAAGNATAVWIESADGSAYVARGARRDAISGAWSAPHELPAAGVADPRTQVRADAAGEAIAAWVEHDPDTGVAFVRAAVAASGTGVWSAPVTLSDPTDASVAFARPQIAPDAGGGALVGWTAQRLADPFDFAIQTTERSSGGGWGAPADLVSAPADEPISAVRLVGADGGGAAASWFQGPSETLWGALRTGGTWTVDDVSGDVAPACEPLQALGPDAGGGATVVWKADSSQGLDSVRLTAGGWEPRVPVFGSATESAEDAAIDRGTVVLVAHDVGGDADSVLASRRQGDGRWSTPALLDAAASGTTLGGADVASDAAGDALASWTATDALGARSVAAAAFQAAGPQLSDVSVPASGTSGEQLAFSASARSAFATVAGTSWDFGDGTPAVVGAAVGHSYVQAGDYTVTITSVDGVGNATQVTRQVSIAEPATATQPPPAGGGTPSPPTRQLALARPRIGGARHGVLALGRGARTLTFVVRNLDGTALRGSATLARPRSGRRPALTLASRRGLAFAADRRTTLTLRLGDQALRALRRASGYRLPARLTLRLRAADGRRISAALTATLDASARFGVGVVRVPGAHMAC